MPERKGWFPTRRSFGTSVASANSRRPRPSTTGYMNNRYSSTSPAAMRSLTNVMLPVVTMSPPALAFSSRISSMKAPRSTVVCCQSGSWTVLDTTYFDTSLR
jgi:hypothetical protein